VAAPYLVLANSRKLGGSCVAVVDESGRWTRPVSDAQHGELTTEQCSIAGTKQVLRPLDVVDAEFGRSRAKPYQPEDREAPADWHIWPSRLAHLRIADWLDASVDHHADFLARGYQDCIPARDITAENPLGSSLALVNPTNPVWMVQQNTYGRRQVRALFTLDGVTDARGSPIEFDLVVTDPLWSDRVIAIANRRLGEVRLPLGDPVYLTLSLGEAFRGRHYKLVAAVVS
jgi:hypothetical protein